MARADGIVGARYDEKLDVVEIVTCKPTEGNVY